jgi:hypothetical protein
MNKTPKSEDKFDWTAVDALTAEEIHSAAMADPDARPMTEEEWAAAPRVEAFPGGVRRAVPHSGRHVARLGAGPLRAGWGRARLSPRDRP